MSSQFRRDRSRFNPQQTWVPRGSSTSIAVVNEPTERSSESLHAGSTPSRPAYLQRQHNSSGHSPYNQHQRSNVTAPPPPNNAPGTRPDNRQRVASNTRPLNEWKRVVKEEKIVVTDPNLPQLVQEIQEKLVKSSIECMICYDKVIRLPICTADVIERYLLPLLLRKEERSAVRSVSDAGSHCHPGPCPPCKAFAPPRSCPCGKKMIHTRCSERRSVLVCGQRCEKLLNCKRHRCDRSCHVGNCDPCQVLVNATCFCKKKVESVICGDMTVKGELKAEDGVYSCNLICGNGLGCGNHLCSEVCHAGPCGDCELLPSRVKTCYCGKKRLEEEIRERVAWSQFLLVQTYALGFFLVGYILAPRCAMEALFSSSHSPALSLFSLSSSLFCRRYLKFKPSPSSDPLKLTLSSSDPLKLTLFSKTVPVPLKLTLYRCSSHFLRWQKM
ncbi:hypothetical protein DY000_02057972 [Brassica cretica]|uniref:NF-X1-type domain-containing protein n=1 Tax=Brassica cretica TaxID=69181 RepID=A0ABQ7AKJ4_BRACR|nr:hypothetical protein DY000_02057972 [Brassica cretica]